MEIFTLLDTLEDLLEEGRGIPFSSKVIVDQEQMIDIIKEIRIKLPDELKQAKWVKEERQRILVEAQKEADNILSNTENVIQETLDKLGTNMSEALNLMQLSLEDTIKTIQNSRKELE